MNGTCLADNSPRQWKDELERLCDKESGWSLLRCLAPLATFRLIDSQSSGSESFSDKMIEGLRENNDLAILAEGLLAITERSSFNEEDALFLSTLANELPRALDLWAEERGPVCTDELTADDDAGGIAAVDAACELLQFVETPPLAEAGCFDVVIRTCLAAAGKTGGLFSTPECVTELVARLVENDVRTTSTLYDPCAGIGFLLSACAANLDAESKTPLLFGQDVDAEAYSLLRMRSIVASLAAGEEPAHPVSAKLGDVLVDPWHLEEAPFDVVVSHAPTLLTWPGKSDEALVADERFACAGALAPKDAADLAFVMHAYHCLAENGVAALIAYPAPLRRGDAEHTIRRHLLEVDAVDAVIQLPPKLFADSSMAASVLVLRKNRTNEGVLFIDAMDTCERIGDTTVLTHEVVERIADAFEAREEIEGFARSVQKDEIAKNGYSLTVADYFKTKAPEISVDVEALKRRLVEVSDPAIFSKRIVNGLIR